MSKLSSYWKQKPEQTSPTKPAITTFPQKMSNWLLFFFFNLAPLILIWAQIRSNPSMLSEKVLQWHWRLSWLDDRKLPTKVKLESTTEWLRLEGTSGCLVQLTPAQLQHTATSSWALSTSKETPLLPREVVHPRGRWHVCIYRFKGNSFGFRWCPLPLVRLKEHCLPSWGALVLLDVQGKCVRPPRVHAAAWEDDFESKSWSLWTLNYKSWIWIVWN